MKRRNFINTVSGLAITGLAGCIGPFDSDNTGNNTTNVTKNRTSSNASIYNSPNISTRNIKNQPMVGSENAENAIIAFEDPSCPYCAKFHNSEFGKVRKAAEEGKVKYYSRVIPIIQEWSQIAIRYLEGVYQEYGDEEYWNLLKFYYNTDNSFSKKNVSQKTVEYMNNNETINTQKIQQNIQNRKYISVVNNDLNVAKQVSINSTPTFLLFKNGRFVTRITGARRFTNFKQVFGI